MVRLRVYFLTILGLSIVASGCVNADKMELTSLNGGPSTASASTATPLATYNGSIRGQASDGGDVSTNSTASFKMARVSIGSDIDKQYGGATASFILTGGIYAGP